MLFTVTDRHDGVLLRSFLKGTCGVSSRLLTRLKQTEKGITVNGEPVTVRRILHTGDTVAIACGDRFAQDVFEPENVPVSVLYEDDAVLLVDKPPFMPTHPSNGHDGDTLANALAYRFRTRGEPFVFRPVNRLDRNTSGVLMIAKNQYAASVLGKAIKEHRIRKTYLSVVDGLLPATAGRMDGWIRRRTPGIVLREVCSRDAPGAESVHTVYETLAVCPDENRSLVRLRPETGRTHQLRVQLASLGCPVTGDGLYGNDSDRIPRQALHALCLEWTHPVSGKRMKTVAPVPEDIRSLCRLWFPDCPEFDSYTN